MIYYNNINGLLFLFNLFLFYLLNYSSLFNTNFKISKSINIFYIFQENYSLKIKFNYSLTLFFLVFICLVFTIYVTQ